MRRILVLTSTYPARQGDGTPPFVHELSKRLAKEADVLLLAPHTKGAAIREDVDGVHVRRFRYFPERWETLASSGGILPALRNGIGGWIQLPFFVAAEALAINRAVKRFRPHVIHAHWLLPQGLLAALMAPHVPFIVTSHGGDAFGLRSLDWLKRFVLRSGRHVTVVSNAIKEQMMKILPTAHVSVIPMGVDAMRFRPARRTYKKGPRLLFVGRLVEKKGARYLIEAMPRIIKEQPGATLTIIGDGPQRAMLETTAHRLEVDGQVTFKGRVQNDKLPAAYRRAHLFVGPSIVARDGDTEGLGLTFVEAALCGCLPIGTTVGGIRDVIEDGVTGWLVEPESPTAIAACVKRAWRDKRRLARMAAAARKKAQAFDWKSIAGRYAKVLG